MREILFRGKRVDNGLWIEGCLRQYPIGSAKICDKEMQHTFRVDPETVGQYTGLTDKNGKKIFEGDIVVYDNSPYNVYCTPQKGEIAWRNGSLCFKYSYHGSMMYHPLCSDDFFAAKCEVIGNIHDNPELMGGTKNEPLRQA